MIPYIGYIGVKRNAERYMFSEPRAPVDAVRARIRESRFSFRHAQAVVNFFAILLNKWLFGPKIPFYPKFAFWAQKPISGPEMLFFAQNRFWAKRGSIFINFPLVL